jgi:hypothetical protein
MNESCEKNVHEKKPDPHFFFERRSMCPLKKKQLKNYLKIIQHFN